VSDFSTMQGQVALVTGATRGIGAAIAQELAARGMKVIGTATTDEGAAKVSAALAEHAFCEGAKLDVNDGKAAEALIEAIGREHGGLHVLVNNAGITRDTLAMRMKDDDWDAVLDTNLKAVFRMSRAVMRTMMKQRYGRIVFIETDMTAALPEAQQRALLGQIPLGHLGQPGDVAHAVAFLSSPLAGYITGQEIHVNGGMFMA
jgi:3-oxoacyl-[acyl-carrier protein] reductase